MEEDIVSTDPLVAYAYLLEVERGKLQDLVQRQNTEWGRDKAALQAVEDVYRCAVSMYDGHGRETQKLTEALGKALEVGKICGDS